jgi:hypothetical protein
MSIAGWARDLREVLLTHRAAAELVAASLAVGLCTRVPDAGAVEVLEADGWPPDDARRATRAIVHFVLGHVIQEQTRQNLLAVGVLTRRPQPWTRMVSNSACGCWSAESRRWWRRAEARGAGEFSRAGGNDRMVNAPDCIPPDSMVT